jgi:ABC-type Fe3+ transport system permease subunit
VLVLVLSIHFAGRERLSWSCSCPLVAASFFLSFNLTSIPGPERSIWRQLHSWLEQNTPVV